MPLKKPTMKRPPGKPPRKLKPMEKKQKTRNRNRRASRKQINCSPHDKAYVPERADNYKKKSF